MVEVTRDQVVELAARGHRSPVEFARVFFPDWFPQPMPWVHRGILALLKGRADFLLDFGEEEWRDAKGYWGPAGLQKILTNFIDQHTKEPLFVLVEQNDTVRVEIRAKDNVVIVMPRGFAKTTILNLNTCHEVAYRDTDYVLYISESGPHAQTQLETVKAEFETNDTVRFVFGDLQPPRQDSKRWGADFIEATSGVMVGAVGTGGQIRGKSKHAKRPTTLVFDDLQDEKSVESETQRAADSRWFWRAAMKAGARHSRKIVTGTILHKEAILSKAMENRMFSSVLFGALDRQGDCLWEWQMDKDALEEDRQSAIESGELQGWYMEMMSEFREDSSRSFPESKLIYIHKGLELFVAVGQAMDPAISPNLRASSAAMAVVGIDGRGFKHVLDIHIQKGMDADDLLDKYFDHHFKWIAHLPPENQKHGIEAIQFQAALLPMARMRMVQESKIHGQRAYFEVVPITHGKTQKETRVKGILRPLIWGGQMTFEYRWPKLHTEFVDFTGQPGQRIDGMDAVAMATALLDPYVMLGLGDEEMAANTNVSLPRLSAYAGRGAP